MKNMEEIKKEIKETFTKTKYNYEEQLNMILRNSNLDAYAINDTANRQIVIQHGDDEDKYTITTYDSIAAMEKSGWTDYDITNHMIMEYKINCFMVDKYKTNIYNNKDKYSTNCIGQWDPDTDILTIKRKDTK